MVIYTNMLVLPYRGAAQNARNAETARHTPAMIWTDVRSFSVNQASETDTNPMSESLKDIKAGSAVCIGRKATDVPGDTQSFCSSGTVVTLCVSGAFKARIVAPRMHKIHPIQPCGNSAIFSVWQIYQGFLFETHKKRQTLVQEELAENGTHHNRNGSQGSY